MIVYGGNYSVYIEDSKFIGNGALGQYNMIYFVDLGKVPTNTLYFKGNNSFRNINSNHQTFGSILSLDTYNMVTLDGQTTFENIGSQLSMIQLSNSIV